MSFRILAFVYGLLACAAAVLRFTCGRDRRVSFGDILVAFSGAVSIFVSIWAYEKRCPTEIAVLFAAASTVMALTVIFRLWKNHSGTHRDIGKTEDKENTDGR